MMFFKSDNGSTGIIPIILMLTIVSVTIFGFIFLVAASNKQVSTVTNDTLNLSGIDYTSEIYNGTNTTLQGLSGVMPNLIWLILIFAIVAFLVMVGVIFGKR